MNNTSNLYDLTDDELYDKLQYHTDQMNALDSLLRPQSVPGYIPTDSASAQPNDDEYTRGSWVLSLGKTPATPFVSPPTTIMPSNPSDPRILTPPQESYTRLLGMIPEEDDVNSAEGANVSPGSPDATWFGDESTQIAPSPWWKGTSSGSVYPTAPTPQPAASGNSWTPRLNNLSAQDDSLIPNYDQGLGSDRFVNYVNSAKNSRAGIAPALITSANGQSSKKAAATNGQAAANSNTGTSVFTYGPNGGVTVTPDNATGGEDSLSSAVVTPMFQNDNTLRGYAKSIMDRFDHAAMESKDTTLATEMKSARPIIQAALQQYGNNIAAAPPNVRAALYALTQLGNKDYGEDGTVTDPEITNIKRGAPKCNVFAAKCYGLGAGIGYNVGGNMPAGYPLNTSTKYGIMHRNYPPAATDMHKPSYAMRNFPPVINSPARQLGDIVAFGDPGHLHGHAAIYLGGNLLIYAGPNDVKLGTIPYIYQEEKFKGSPTYRRYRPKP